MINHSTLNKFEKLYNDSYSTISKYVVCNCSNIEDVKDIIQNIYLEVYKKLDKINNTSYILGIAKNKIKDYYRFYKRRKIISLFDAKNNMNLIENIPNEINIEKSYLNKYNVEQVWNYLKRKNVIIAKIFYLYYYLDFTIKEISKELNITESSVKNHLYRTLKELNIYLEGIGDENV